MLASLTGLLAGWQAQQAGKIRHGDTMEPASDQLCPEGPKRAKLVT